MKRELRRIDPLRAANISALVYGLMMTAFAVLFLPFVLFAAILAPAGEFGLAGPVFFGFMLMIYPIIGFVMGWIGGLLGAAIYNLVVRWCGGLLLEFADAPPAASPGTA
jgi:hypothetical protein